MQRAVIRQRTPQPLAHRLVRVGAVGVRDARPGFGLGVLDPAHHIVRKQRQPAVSARRIPRIVQSARGGEVTADLVFESFFGVEGGHRGEGGGGRSEFNVIATRWLGLTCFMLWPSQPSSRRSAAHDAEALSCPERICQLTTRCCR